MLLRVMYAKIILDKAPMHGRRRKIHNEEKDTDLADGPVLAFLCARKGGRPARLAGVLAFRIKAKAGDRRAFAR